MPRWMRRLLCCVQPQEPEEGWLPWSAYRRMLERMRAAENDPLPRIKAQQQIKVLPEEPQESSNRRQCHRSRTHVVVAEGDGEPQSETSCHSVCYVPGQGDHLTYEGFITAEIADCIPRGSEFPVDGLLMLLLILACLLLRILAPQSPKQTLRTSSTLRSLVAEGGNPSQPVAWAPPTCDFPKPVVTSSILVDDGRMTSNSVLGSLTTHDPPVGTPSPHPTETSRSTWSDGTAMSTSSRSSLVTPRSESEELSEYFTPRELSIGSTSVGTVTTVSSYETVSEGTYCTIFAHPSMSGTKEFLSPQSITQYEDIFYFQDADSSKVYEDASRGVVTPDSASHTARISDQISGVHPPSRASTTSGQAWRRSQRRSSSGSRLRMRSRAAGRVVTRARVRAAAFFRLRDAFSIFFLRSGRVVTVRPAPRSWSRQIKHNKTYWATGN